jgi:hypothetical protein
MFSLDNFNETGNTGLYYVKSNMKTINANMLKNPLTRDFLYLSLKSFDDTIIMIANKTVVIAVNRME